MLAKIQRKLISYSLYRTASKVRRSQRINLIILRLTFHLQVKILSPSQKINKIFKESKFLIQLQRKDKQDHLLLEKGLNLKVRLKIKRKL